MNRYLWRVKRFTSVRCDHCSGYRNCICRPYKIIDIIVPYPTTPVDPEPVFVGRMPIRQDVGILPVDENIEAERNRILLMAGFEPIKPLKLGWIANERIRIPLINPALLGNI